MLDVDWSQIKILVNNKEIRIPPVITVLVIYKYKVRRIMNKPTLSFHMMIKKGYTWLSLPLEKTTKGI